MKKHNIRTPVSVIDDVQEHQLEQEKLVVPKIKIDFSSNLDTLDYFTLQSLLLNFINGHYIVQTHERIK